MNIHDLEKAVNNIDAIPSEIRKDPAIARDMDQIRQKLIRKARKQFTDDGMLESLVYLIEICGESRKQSFKALGKVKMFTEARAKKLWFDTRKHNLQKIEDLRQYHAYRLTSDLLTWMKGDQTEPLPESRTLLRLKNEEPALWDWAATIVLLDDRGTKHRDFKPNYKKPVEVPEKDLLSFQKEIASSD